ncbi:hypothetical protein M8C21_008077 [Ambrosia artemisiifolia]|uniref:non-specific serine/threonine protein kinase n=1 Tax=Ambrosia artemisiifolia TaxID=4212 RepID=A0AAD5BPL6_AMBAR|nr:hypothetical protein M8C21_008077 [Ambrosia artemisiifolia]
MHTLKHNINPSPSLNWSDPNPCNWAHVTCNKDNRIIAIQANGLNLKGSLPKTLNNLTQLQLLELQYNQLTGPLPSLTRLTHLQNLFLNNNKFTSIPSDFFDGMSSLQKVFLDHNSFDSWSIPDSLKIASNLHIFSATATNLTGKIPDFFGSGTFTGLVTLRLSLNRLEGGLPSTFSGSLIKSLWLNDQKSLHRLNGSVGVLQHMTQLTEVWLHGNRFSGSLPELWGLNHLQRLSLRDNRLTGPIPASLTGLQSLKVVNLSNNMFQGPMPKFDESVFVDHMIGIDSFCLKVPGKECDSRVNMLIDVAESVGYPQVFAEKWKGNDPCALWLGITCSSRGEITVVNFRSMGLSGGISSNFSSIKSLQRLVLADNNLTGVIPKALKDLPHLVEIDVSNNQLYGDVPNFKANVTVDTSGNPKIEGLAPAVAPAVVYKGELHDGTKIAVKRMESSVTSEKGLDEFQSEISVLTKFRHRNIVALLGYCLDGNERLLVFEYMPQGTLSRFLFNWEREGLKPLDWATRLVIALDVAKGVEYLHGLAQQSFIHRDLKPSNILLDDDMRAKVGDFGLIRLAPSGKVSLVTQLAGTFGYLAPEYAVMGRVTTKIDVFSFGVILMELITGRKALEETQPEDSVHLVQWFKKMHIKKATFRKAIDPCLEPYLDETALASVTIVAELAGHCCARESWQRPNMSHVVRVLSSLTDLWKPTESDPDDIYGIDLETPLPQVVKRWQAMDNQSGRTDNTRSSLNSAAYAYHDPMASAVNSDGENRF